MGIGLGGIIGGIVGGAAGFSAGGPAGGFAGFSAGASIGEAAFGGDDDTGSAGDALRAQQLEEARRQQAEWDKVYGPIQDKLAKNLRNMSLATVSALGLEGVEQEFEAAGVQIRQQVAQRGLEGSGLEQEFKSRAAISKAEAKAEVRAEAPAKLEAAQRSFLSLGLAQKDRQSLESRLLGEQAGIADRAESIRRAEEAAEGAQLGQVVGAAGEILGRSGAFDKTNVITPPEPEIRIDDEPELGEN